MYGVPHILWQEIGEILSFELKCLIIGMWA